MNQKILWTLPLSVAMLVACQQGEVVSKKTALTTDDEKISYAIGQDMGKTLKQLEIDLDMSLVYRGIQDIMKSDSNGLLTEEERSKAMETLMTRIRDARAKKDSLATIENQAKAAEFLAKNKSEQGVITTASGLQYMVVQEGNGPAPLATDTVVAHYVGTLLDGTEFDNSTKRGQPITFPVGGVIPGWQELLPLMKTGSKVKSWIPPELGYGSRNAGRIPPNSMLIFEIELIEVKKGPAAPKVASPAAAPAPAAK